MKHFLLAACCLLINKIYATPKFILTCQQTCIDMFNGQTQNGKKKWNLSDAEGAFKYCKNDTGDVLAIAYYTIQTDTVKIDSIILRFNPKPTVFAGKLPNACNTDAVFDLNNYGSPHGVWTCEKNQSAFIDYNIVSPRKLGVGKHVLTLHYTNPQTSCRNSDTATLIVDSCGTVSLEKTVLMGFSLYRDQNLLNIKGLSSNSIIEIYDLSGKRLSFNYIDHTCIDISLLEAGLYVIYIKSHDAMFQTKFIKI